MFYASFRCNNILVKCIFSIVALVLIVIIIRNICGVERVFNDGMVLLFICVFVIILFGKLGILSKFELVYGNKVFCYLGALSMPIYLFQNVFHYWVKFFFYGQSTWVRIMMIYIGTILFSIIVKSVLDRCKRKRLNN